MEVLGRAALSGRVKVTKPDGTVEYQNLQMDHEEVYLLPDGTLSTTYPKNGEVQD